MEETTIHNYTSKYSLKHGTSNHISSELNLVSGRAFFSRVRESVLLNTAPKQEIYHGHILHCCRISSNIMIQGKLLTIILVQPNTCWKPYHDLQYVGASSTSISRKMREHMLFQQYRCVLPWTLAAPTLPIIVHRIWTFFS